MVKPSTICKRDGCNKPAALDGLCKPHWHARDHHLALAYWREKARDN